MNKSNVCKKINIFLLTTATTLFSSVAYAQSFSIEAAAQISKSITKGVFSKFKYPDELISNCVPTFANLLLRIDSKGSIQSISISDNAPQDLRNSFQEHAKDFDLKLIQKLLLSAKVKNCAISIPLYYTFQAEYCKTEFNIELFKADTYYKYNEVYNSLPAFNLPPIVFIIYPPVR